MYVMMTVFIVYSGTGTDSVNEIVFEWFLPKKTPQIKVREI